MATTEDLVRASLDGNVADATAAFNDLMSVRIASRIDDLRSTVAATLVNPRGENVSDSNES